MSKHLRYFLYQITRFKSLLEAAGFTEEAQEVLSKPPSSHKDVAMKQQEGETQQLFTFTQCAEDNSILIYKKAFNSCFQSFQPLGALILCRLSQAEVVNEIYGEG